VNLPEKSNLTVPTIGELAVKIREPLRVVTLENPLAVSYYHGNPQPSFLGVITHMLGVQNLHFSWFWGPKVSGANYGCQPRYDSMVIKGV